MRYASFFSTQTDAICASKQKPVFQEMACPKKFAWLVPRLGMSKIHEHGHVPRAGLSFDHSRACPIAVQSHCIEMQPPVKRSRGNLCSHAFLPMGQA